MRDQERLNFLLLTAYFAAVGAILYFGFRYVVSWLLPFLLGAGVAALLRPAALSLARRSRMSERFCAALTLLLFYLAAASAVGLFLTIILAQCYELLLRLPEIYTLNIAPVLDKLGNWFYGLAGRFNPDTGQSLEQLSAAVSEAIQLTAVNGSTHLVGWAAGFVAKLPMHLLAAVFTIVISILTATNYRKVSHFLCGLIPKKYASCFAGLQRFLRDTIWRMVRAYTIIMAITFIELSAGLWLLGFDYVMPISAAITLLDLLPLIGSGTILVPWGIVLIIGGDMPGGIGLLLLFGIIAVVRNIIEPRIVGKQIGLHPIVTITAMYAGLKIAGFKGLLAAPILVLLVLYVWKSTRTAGERQPPNPAGGFV